MLKFMIYIFILFFAIYLIFKAFGHQRNRRIRIECDKQNFHPDYINLDGKIAYDLNSGRIMVRNGSNFSFVHKRDILSYSHNGYNIIINTKNFHCPMLVVELNNIGVNNEFARLEAFLAR